MKYDDLRNSDEFPELPAVVLLLDSVVSSIKIINETSVIRASRDVETLTGVLAILNDLHYRLTNSIVSPF